DINGYYAPQRGITLAQGTAAGPSLSFSGDPGTGIFSSGASTLNIATAGANRLTLDSGGNVAITGAVSIGGGAFVTNSSTIGQSGATPLTVTLPMGTSIATASCISQTVAALGAATSMAVMISPAGDPNSRGLSKVIWQAYVPTNDQVTAEFCRFGGPGG